MTWKMSSWGEHLLCHCLVSVYFPAARSRHLRSRFPKQILEIWIWVSFAKDWDWMEWRWIKREFVERMKRTGPNTDPCGTPWESRETCDIWHGGLVLSLIAVFELSEDSLVVWLRMHLSRLLERALVSHALKKFLFKPRSGVLRTQKLSCWELRAVNSSLFKAWST